jgi:inosose dehydratase
MQGAIGLNEDVPMQTIHRRQLLQGVSASLLCHGMIGAAEEPPQRLFPFGFSLYGAPGVAPATALPAIARIGYDCVELACLRGSPTEPNTLTAAERAELRKLLADNGLALASLMENLTEPSDDAAHAANLDRLRAACQLGHALSPDAPPVVETILGHKPAQWEAVKGPMVQRLRDWAALAEKHQTVIAVKPHVGNALHTPADAVWLVEQLHSPWIRLAYDYSHYLLRGLPLAETISAVAPHAAFVHVKDARGTPEKFEFLLPGETDLNYRQLFGLLHAAGYRGPVVVEVSSQLSRRAGYDWLAAARRSHDNLAPALAAGRAR